MKQSQIGALFSRFPEFAAAASRQGSTPAIRVAVAPATAVAAHTAHEGQTTPNADTADAAEDLEDADEEADEEGAAP